MEELFTALTQAFLDYRQDLENYQKKAKPTDGLLGFGHSLQNDPCHEKLDEAVKKAVNAISTAGPSQAEAEKAVRFLLSPSDGKPWPLAAEWMLRAVERHTLPLIPFLSKEAAGVFLREYTKRYKPWERLPAQKEVYKALKEKGGGA